MRADVAGRLVGSPTSTSDVVLPAVMSEGHRTPLRSRSVRRGDLDPRELFLSLTPTSCSGARISKAWAWFTEDRVP